MRREVLQVAVERIVDDLQTSGIADMLQEGVTNYNGGRPKENQQDWISLECITEYINAVRSYNKVESEILSILSIDELSYTAFWQSSMREFEPQKFFPLGSRVRQVLSFLPRIMHLLDREYDHKENRPVDDNGVSVQTVVLSDEGESLSSPDRLIELLRSIQEIYSVLASIDGVPSESLAVVGMDSGSEKSFDFLGVARLMHELRETLQSAYNMIAFHKQNVTMKNLQVAGESLAVIAKIGKLQQSQVISEEEAARLKYSLYAGVERFTCTGAYIPEMNAVQPLPALVMKPQPRLLTGPVEELVRGANPAQDQQGEADNLPPPQEDDNNGFSSDEIAAAVQLLKKSRASTSAPSARHRNKPKPVGPKA